ncbi:putative DNA binding domain-containing protein [Desulfovibrio sp. OttesenSCG-928-A18]|nr:putative DNA binding domain-containing protein [Desulfovibrio sp. OttesenSCG-928-A18]
MRESETTEFKKSLTQLKEGIISLAAMLNKHGGGELWFGIRDDGTALGLDAGDKTIRDISQAIAAHVEPKVYPVVTLAKVHGKPCVKVAFSGSEAPYFAYGRAYIRVADEDRQLSAKELENFILGKNHETLRWDNKASKATVADLDEKKIKSFVKQAELPWDNMPNVLEKLDVMRDGHLLNTAPLFFGKKATAKLRCAVFASTSTSTILDRHDYDGDILALIEEAQKYILKNIHIGMRLEGLYRVDVPEISVAALREAVINAFCHRDYRDPEEVRVAIFKDRVEIRNPGNLFGGLTIEDLRTGNISKRRNPLIADLLRRIHMVEGWGRGIPLILESEPDVKFEEVAQIFITAFARRSYSLEDGESVDADTKTSTKTNMKTSTKTAGGMLDTLPEREKKILSIIVDTPAISLQDIASKTGLSKSGVRHHIDKFKKQGILRRIGGAKGGRWEVVGIDVR